MLSAPQRALKQAALALRDTGGMECTAAFRREATSAAILDLFEQIEKLHQTVAEQDGQLQAAYP